MGQLIRLSAFGCALVACGGLAPAIAGQTNGTITTAVLGPVAMLNTAPLNFGNIARGAGGTVTVNAQTGTQTSAGVIHMGGAVSNAKFIATGTPNRVVTLALAPSPIVISNGAATMTINQLRVSVNGGGPQPLGPNHNLGPTGVINFAAGGRLTIATNQAAGTYTGTFTLTMDYQ